MPSTTIATMEQVLSCVHQNDYFPFTDKWASTEDIGNAIFSSMKYPRNMAYGICVLWHRLGCLTPLMETWARRVYRHYDQSTDKFVWTAPKEPLILTSAAEVMQKSKQLVKSFRSAKRNNRGFNSIFTI